MSTNRFKTIIRWSIFPLLLFASIYKVSAQTTDGATLKLSLSEAVKHAKESNKLIGVLQTEENATQEDLKDAKMGSLPRIGTSASYQRYTKITLYDGVIGNPHQIPKPPNANAGALGIESSFNLYAGGRQKSVVRDAVRKTELAGINTDEQVANVGLQVALQYLEMVKYFFQGKLIKDQITRAQTRSKNINAFYVNGKVTKSDLLRADVLLSNTELNKAANDNDYLISNQRLNTYLNLDKNTKVVPIDTASLALADSLAFAQLASDHSGTYSILKLNKNIELQDNRIKLVKSFNRPNVSLFGGYGFNYPNNLVFPPVAQTFAVGLAGIKLSYDISSLYQNKSKLKAAKIRATELRQQKDWVTDNVDQEVSALAIKYNEAIRRMQVIRKSIEQAKTNYDIQNTKYLNHLSLLTDLLDADNLYQESRYNYVQANIAALSIYYRLLFTTGKL